MTRGTSFSRLARLCSELESLTKRKVKAELVGEFLRELRNEEILPAVHLIVGSIFAESSSKNLEVSWSTLQRVVEEKLQERLLKKSLTILDVHKSLDNVAKTSGPGSRRRKEEILRSLFGQASREEAKWIMKNIFGEMQHGVGEGVMLESIAYGSDTPLELVRRAHSYTGNLGRTAMISMTKGEAGLRSIGIQMFRPIKPMLAQIADDVDDVFKEHGRPTAFEYKFDGARIQIHIQGDQVKIYSRRLTEVTHSLPEIVQTVRKNIQSDNTILEGEVIAVGREGRPLPFQDLMRRFTRVHEIEALKRRIPLRLHLFDIIYLDGQTLVDTPYRERWQRLLQTCKENLLVDRIVSGDNREVQSFLQSAIGNGHEGLMAKRLDSLYTPGRRGKRWLKVKPADQLDLAITAADWGYGRRTGWLSNYHLAASNQETGQFEVVGKTFKGLTDEQFKWMTNKLKELKIRERTHTVFVRPEIVVEVAYNEIQKSPKYKSGFALRFARVKRIREDKSPREVSTIEEIRETYERQFKYKSKEVET